MPRLRGGPLYGLLRRLPEVRLLPRVRRCVGWVPLPSPSSGKAVAVSVLDGWDDDRDSRFDWLCTAFFFLAAVCARVIDGGSSAWRWLFRRA